MRKPHKYKVYDAVHKAGVSFLLLTFASLSGKLMYDVYYWRRYQLPARREETRKAFEAELAQKQVQEAEQLAKQEVLQEEVKKIQ